MSDPYDDVPVPLASRGNFGCLFFVIPVVALLIAIFILRLPWWGDVLTPIGALVVVAIALRLYEDGQREAWIRRHPEIKRPPPT